MDAFWLSIELALWTTLLLLPIGLVVGRLLAWQRWRAIPWIESLILLPLVLPPTVLGYYLLVTLSPGSPIGAAAQSLFGIPLVFSFPGLVLASVIVNLPFAIQPMQQSFAAIPLDVREAAWVGGLSHTQCLLRIELPLAWPGIVSAMALVFAHTLGEFGVVLMVGGNIEGETRTLSIAIYDSVQAFDMQGAGRMTFALVIFCVLALGVVRFTGFRGGRAAEH